MKIAMACDHGGFHLKEHIKKYLTEKGIEIVDHGTYNEDSVDCTRWRKCMKKLRRMIKQSMRMSES